MAKGDRLLAAARARVILPAAGGVWAGAEVLHLAHANPAPVTVGAAAVAGLTCLTRARPLASPVAAAGVWLTAATAYGPLAGPRWWYPLTITWSAAALAALRAARRHPAVQEARRNRAARRALVAEAHVLGIRGAHLIRCQETRLGEMWELDVAGTGQLASAIARGAGLAERIAQQRSLPKSRVRVTEGHIAGRVTVSIRYRDPWEHPIPHPLFDGEPEIALPVPCTVTEPFPVGQDPETGAPLEVTVWDEIGAKVIMVIGKRGAGKDVLLSNIRERVSAAGDADLWQVNLSKAQEERAWEGACEPGYSACGPEARDRARAILRAARRLVDERGARHRPGTVLRPTETDRLKTLVINEVDALLRLCPDAKDDLRYLTSKARSEGVALVIAGQRAVFHWIGGTDVKANVDYVAVGKVHDAGEVNHAVGRLIGAALPDMSIYGEGKPGVWCIVDDGGNYGIGRTFELPANGDLEVIRELARERSPRVPVPVGASNLPVSNLPVSNLPAGNPPPGDGTPHVPAGGDIPLPGPGDPLAGLDAELEREMPDDLRDQLSKITGKNADTRRALEELEALPPLPEVDQERQAEIAAERWRHIADQAAIPPDVHDRLLALLAEGTTIKTAAADLGVKPWPVRCWLEKLRQDGTAWIDGKGRGAKWRLVVNTNSDDG